MIVPTNTSNYSNSTGSPISISVIWPDDSGSNPGKYIVLFSGSSDSGTSFGDPVNISDNQGTSLSRMIATSGNNAYITWTEYNSGYYAILFRNRSITIEVTPCKPPFNKMSTQSRETDHDYQTTIYSPGGCWF